MSQRLKITLSDAVMAGLRDIAARDGVPIARVAAERLSQTTPDDRTGDSVSSLPALIDDDLIDDRHAPWIEPVMGDLGWRRRMWGSIAALYGRYPRQLAYLRDGWWKGLVPYGGAMCAGCLAGLDRCRRRGPATRAGLPSPAHRLQPPATSRRRQRHDCMEAGRRAARVARLRSPSTIRTSSKTRLL
jgi:hypothetical protein